MDNTSIEVELPSDDEGYVSFQCPACGDRFKLAAAEVNERDPDELYCPLCGLVAEAGDFHDPEVIALAMEHAQNVIAALLNNWTRGMERSFAGAQSVNFTRGTDLPLEEVRSLRETPDLLIAEFGCCRSTAKLAASSALSLAYCPFCGRTKL